ncbi:MAG: 3-dehydroquinate synthase [Candidatus Obscuribacterales bacterium]|nr:3-dehydroquinate synthase [Candidatus Obscuribacterales bacterium]
MSMRHKRHRGPVVTINWNTTLEVKTRVAVGSGARHKLNSVLAQIGSGRRVLLICQPSTAVHWLRDVMAVLPSEDFQVTTLEVPDGEACKTPEWLIRVWEHLQDRKFERKDTVVALGGGSVSDLAGFAASTYMRGLNLVLLPTSLLAQVDAAIGGKTGINLSAGKNLAGSFYFPKAVIADSEMLVSLPQKQLISGLGEIYKYALIEDTVAKHTDYEVGPRSLLELLEAMAGHTLTAEDPSLGGIISSCIKMKLFVVGKDPHESGLRRCLNLGHTLGHALEKMGDYSLSHGEAVAIGLVADTKLSVDQKRIEKDSLKRLQQMLEKAGLPTKVPSAFRAEKLIEAMSMDKKRDGDKIKLVLPQAKLGQVELDVPISPDDLARVI